MKNLKYKIKTVFRLTNCINNISKKKLFPTLLYTAFVLSALNLISCEENISSKGPFSEKYALFCLINTDTTFQTAYISRSFNADDHSDPALTGAVLKLKVNNNVVYTFQEGTTTRIDTSVYKTPVKYYYLNNFKPNDEDKLEITATLANGEILKAAAVAPPYSLLYCAAYGTIDYNPAVYSNLIMSWRFVGGYNADDFFFTSKLFLVYSKRDNPDKMIRVKMPIEYKKSGETWLPAYKNITQGGGVIYLRDAITRLLASISQGDSNKNNYIIREAEFTLQLIDNNLAIYNVAENTFNDEFSVRLDATDYTNIQNGFGLFGVYSTKRAKVRISSNYINSLGYGTTY